MQRELLTFPICPALKSKLTVGGFMIVEDLKDMKPSLLSKEINITKEEAVNLLKMVFPEPSSKITVQSRSLTALELLAEEQSQQRIITFSQQLDMMLGGGIALTKITELCGAPGVGKTQMCFQLCVDVQMPEVFGGVEGEAIFIDTEGSFIVERVMDIAKGTVDHCNIVSQTGHNPEQLEAMKSFTVDSILSRIHYYRCQNYVELLAVVHLLPDFLKEHPQVRLLTVDSIAFHFRHDFSDFSLRTRLLNGLAQSFIRIVTGHALAIVLTNHMTTKISTGVESLLIPALGESWGHVCTIRVILFWENSQRYATLYKSPTNKETTVPFLVTMSGIRDLPEAVQSQADIDNNIEDMKNHISKKRKTD